MALGECLNNAVAPVVIDNGSSTCKAGFAEQDKPKVVMPTIIGGPGSSTIGGNDTGEERLLSHPIQDGAIVDWDSMEKIWSRIFQNELQIHLEDHPILHTDTPFSPKTTREKMAEIMFETLASPSLFIINEAVLPLYASGRTSGTVVYSGADVSYTICVQHGHNLPQTLTKSHVTGNLVTKYLKKLLVRQQDTKTVVSHDMFNVIPMKSYNKIKEELSYVAIDFEREFQTTSNTNRSQLYELPDGVSFTLATERFQCSETLFRPALAGLACPGLHECCQLSIRNCTEDIHRELYSNIVLAGGTTMCTGMDDRMEKELSVLVPPTMELNVYAAPERQFSVWLGGSILASLSTFQQMWVSKMEYEEMGPSVVRRKCY